MKNPEPARAHNDSPVFEVLSYFFRLGLLGFGGPLALVGYMQSDLVENRRWMDRDEFAKSFALIKAMPGPVAFQTSVFLGRHRAGWKGGLAAALGMNGPAFLLMLTFGAFYERMKSVGGAPAFLSGMQAASLGVILASLKNLGWSHRQKPIFWFLTFITVILTFIAAMYEPFFILGGGLLTAALFEWKNRALSRDPSGATIPNWLRDLRLAVTPMTPLVSRAGASAASAVILQPDYARLIWACFRSGAFVFGSGLAIVPLMENDFVRRFGWLSHQEFMDALAFGQITPGPVVITATFIGYKSLGIGGACAATAAVFAAPFFHMMTWFPRLVGRMSKLRWISAFLTGAIAAVCGSILATTLRLATTLDYKVVAVPLITLSLAAALFSKIPVWLLIPAGGLFGWLASLVL